MSYVKNKILLVNPPGEFATPVLPLGLAYIASYLKRNDKDINVSVIDAWAENLGLEELREAVSKSQADIVGVYMVSPVYEKGKKTIEACRMALPNSIIIAGGPHPSAVPVETLKDIPRLDICCVGEGEITMHELVNGYQLSAIKGIVFRDGGEIKINPPREVIKNLDGLPFPDRSIFPLKKYRTHPPYGKKNPYFSLITSRGCPFRCAYCSKDVFRYNYRALSPKRVCDELEELISKYGAKEVHFYDDDFTLNMQRAGEICDEIIRRNIKIIWSCTTRVDLVTDELLKKMKKAGCWLISYGVESGNQKILDAINKGFTVEQVISAFEKTRKTGISTLGFFMVGLPGETKSTIQETINLAKKIKPDFVSWGILIVHPGSDFYKLIQAGNYKGKLRTLDKGKDLAGTFFGRGSFVVFEDNLTYEELREEVKRANKEFYLRPSYIIKSLIDIRSFSNLSHYLKGGIEVIKSTLNI